MDCTHYFVCLRRRLAADGILSLSGSSVCTFVIKSVSTISYKPFVEFHRIYSSGAVGDKDKVIRF